MSYSQKLKDELCECRLHCPGCARALLYGMLLFSRTAARDEAVFITENKSAATLFAHTAIDLTAAIVTMRDPEKKEYMKRLSYSVILEDPDDWSRMMRLFFKSGRPERTGIRYSLIKRKCCAMAFLRGAYLACGTMANPEKEYHLEFNTMEGDLCDELIAFLHLYDLDFHRSVRGKNAVAYTKESNQAEDFLARLGAVKASLELMNLKIEKELRNKVNRVTNCETANIDKTVTASMEQIQKIRRLDLEQLPPPLREAAQLRLANPDASLRELCELAGGQITRSGLNHRLQRVMELADKIGEVD